jgi:prepilin signal peptidase PulO-like enzyme (type II secretory pathway)
MNYESQIYMLLIYAHFAYTDAKTHNLNRWLIGITYLACSFMLFYQPEGMFLILLGIGGIIVLNELNIAHTGKLAMALGDVFIIPPYLSFFNIYDVGYAVIPLFFAQVVSGLKYKLNHKETSIPLAPFLFAGMVVYFIVSNKLWQTLI